jgi:hypothetical protein
MGNGLYRLTKERGQIVRERRGSARRSLKWKATINGNDSNGVSFDEEGVIENLSSTGAFFYLKREVAVGAKLDLAILLPFQKENWMKYSAEVVRVEQVPQKIGVGIRFQNLRPNFTGK